MIHITVNDELKKQLKEEADKLQLTLNAYIRMILIKRNGE